MKLPRLYERKFEGEIIGSSFSICVGDEETEVLPEIEVLPDEETEREIKTLPSDDPWNVPAPKVNPTPKGFSLL